MLFFLLWGVLLWGATTIVFRLGGHYFIQTDNPWWMMLTFVAIVPLTIAATYPLYRWRRVSLPDRPLAALLVTLPGLLLNVVTFLLYSRILSNLEPDSERWFGAWILLFHALVLVTGFVREPQARRV